MTVDHEEGTQLVPATLFIECDEGERAFKGEMFGHIENVAGEIGSLLFLFQSLPLVFIHSLIAFKTFHHKLFRSQTLFKNLQRRITCHVPNFKIFIFQSLSAAVFEFKRDMKLCYGVSLPASVFK
ncbi:hypothetical protein Tcan_12917 [Toxocara canis]|uniref:Uncharacterized protein n=1 Tax=Toxocara canis TaxID=6265 RepID=A0A0B2W0G3_TOXCA|nr:hypothetical protein Tcan_12917 [Toxocara canis]